MKYPFRGAERSYGIPARVLREDWNKEIQNEGRLGPAVFFLN